MMFTTILSCHFREAAKGCWQPSRNASSAVFLACHTKDFVTWQSFFSSQWLYQTPRKMTTKKALSKKKQACYYCSKLYSKIGRLLINVHANETEVSKALSFKTSTEERMTQLEKIRHMGKSHQNIQVFETGIGDLIVARRPSQGAKPGTGDFLACTYCLGFFRKGELWRHPKTWV